MLDDFFSESDVWSRQILTSKVDPRADRVNSSPNVTGFQPQITPTWKPAQFPVAVSSSLRPCIDVFALPEKFNMAETESDPDPKVRKLSVTFNDCATSQLSIWAWNWNATDSEKPISTWLFSDIFRYDSPKKCTTILCAVNLWLKPVGLVIHRALCCLFRPDTDGTRESKCGQLSQQTRRLDPMLFQCWSSAVGGGPILKQHWVKCSRLLGSTQVSVYTHPSATIIFSPADQGTFDKTAGQSQAYYNTWNWERGDIWCQPSAHFNMRRSSV